MPQLPLKASFAASGQVSVANATGTLCGAKIVRSYRKLDFDRKICYNYLVKTREEQEEKKT